MRHGGFEPLTNSVKPLILLGFLAVPFGKNGKNLGKNDFYQPKALVISSTVSLLSYML